MAVPASGASDINRLGAQSHARKFLTVVAGLALNVAADALRWEWPA